MPSASPPLIGPLADGGLGLHCPAKINLALSVGIFPYVLKLLQSPMGDMRAVLVFIWVKILGLDQRLLKGRHFRRGPYNSHDNPVILCNCTFLYIFKNKVFLTFIVLELLLGKAELVLGPLEALLQCIDLRSQCGGG
mgnify:CR=1 FL=1